MPVEWNELAKPTIIIRLDVVHTHTTKLSMDDLPDFEQLAAAANGGADVGSLLSHFSRELVTSVGGKDLQLSNKDDDLPVLDDLESQGMWLYFNTIGCPKKNDNLTLGHPVCRLQNVWYLVPPNVKATFCYVVLCFHDLPFPPTHSVINKIILTSISPYCAML